MIPRLPIPQGPILEYVKSEYQGEGHAAKKRVVQETAELANKILASYAFYVEGPETVTDEHRQKFKQDIERYGKQAVEVRKFAQQSDAPTPSQANIEAMVSAQKRLADEEREGLDAVLQRTLGELGVDREVPNVDARDTLDSVMNKIDDEQYLMYYGTLEQIVTKCVGCAVDGQVRPRDFEEIEVSLKVAIERSTGG